MPIVAQFTRISTNTTVSVAAGGPILFSDLLPKTNDLTALYRYMYADKKTTVDLPATKIAPQFTTFIGIFPGNMPGPALDTASGGTATTTPPPSTVVIATETQTYKTPDGTYILLDPGTVVPAGWVVTSTPGAKLYRFQDDNGVFVMIGIKESSFIPTGYYATEPGTYRFKSWSSTNVYDIYDLPENAPTHGYATTLLEYAAPGQSLPEISYEDRTYQPSDATYGAAIPVNNGIPQDSSSLANFNLGTLGYIAGIIGVAGIAYASYLLLFKPNTFKAYAELVRAASGVIIDLSSVILILVVLAALGFVGYEFYAAYQSTGTIGGAIGKLTANTIEVVVSAAVDAVEELFKDLADYLITGIKSIF